MVVQFRINRALNVTEIVYKLEDLKSATKSTSKAGIGEIFPWTEEGNNCKQVK